MTEQEFFAKYTGDGSSASSSQSSGNTADSTRGRGRNGNLRNEYLKKNDNSVWSAFQSDIDEYNAQNQFLKNATDTRGRSRVRGGLHDEFVLKHPDIPTISSSELPTANQTVSDLQKRKKELEDERSRNARYSLNDGVLTNNNTDYDAQIADIDKRIAETKKQDDYRSVWDKLVDTVTGAISGSAASKSDAMRALYEKGQNSRTAEYERDIAELQKQVDKAQAAYDETVALEGEENAQVEKNILEDVQRKLEAYQKVVNEQVQQKATTATAELADQLQQDSAERIERAKDGSGAVGKFAVDAGVAATQMGIDALTGRALGIGNFGSKASMALRAFGGGTQEARQGGGDINQQLGYGSGVAATELITEMLTGGGLDMIYGEGFADKLVEKGIAKMAKTDAGRTALRMILDGSGEGAEEIISDAVNPILRTIYNGKSIGENYSEEQISNWLYDGLVGAALGVGGSVVNIANGENAKKNADLRSPETEAQTKAAAETQVRQQTEAETQAKATRAVLDDILSRGRVNQQQTAQIMNSPEFARMFEALTGHKLEGNTNQQRTEIQQAAREYAYNKGEQAQQAAAERRAEAERQSTAEQTQTEAERALSEYSQQEAARDAEWTERRQQMENYGSYDSYVRGLIRDGMTPAEAGEIARNPQMREAWERVTGQKLPTDSTNRARQMIMETRADVPMPQNQAPVTPQNSVQTQGDISIPPTTSNYVVARSQELNSAPTTGATVQNAEAQKNTAPNGTATQYSQAYDADGAADIRRETSKFKNVVAGFDTSVREFFNKWANGRKSHQGDKLEKLYLGEITDEARAKLSSLLGYDVTSTDYILTNDGVKHILDQHGNANAEIKKGNLPITDTVLESLPDVLAHPDSIELGHAEGRGDRMGIVFKKNLPDGTAVYIQFDNTGRGTIEGKTLYVKPASTLGVNVAKATNTFTSETARPDARSRSVNTASASDGTSALSGDLETVASTNNISDTSIPTPRQNVNSGQAENSGRPFEPTYNREASNPSREKLSQFWENTLQKNEAAAGTPAEVSQPLSYLPKTEKQSLAEAASRLSTDRQGTVENLVNSEAWSGVQADAAWQIASDLYSEAARTGNYEAYTSWRKVMQEHTTAGAQGLQAQAKYTRHNGENALDSIAAAIADSKLTEAQQKALIDKVGTYATRFDNITRGIPDATSPTAASSGKPSADLVSLIEEMARERNTWTFKDNVYSDLLKKQNNAYLKEYAYKQLIAMGNDSLATVSTADKVKAAQSMAQLSSIATFARNIGGNVTFGAVDTLTQNGFGVALDSLVSKATGKRTVAVDKGWFSSEARKGSIDAMQKSILEVAGDVDMGGGNRYGQSSGRAYKMTGSPVERFMSRWQQLMGYSLTTSDKFSRGGIEAEQVRGLSELKNSGLTDAEIQQLASTMADYRLFQNQGIAYTASKATHDFLNLVGFGGKVNGAKRTGGFGLGDFVNTYPGVPANLGVKALEYSPANVIKGGVELFNLLNSAKQGKIDVSKQQQAVMDISRGLAGVPAFALFGALARAGFIHNWDDEEDADVKAQNAAEGKNGIQLNLSGALRWLKGEENALEWRPGDKLDSIGWLEPINAFMAIGTLMAQEPEDASVWSYVGDIAEGSIQAFLDIPVVSNLADMVDTLQYSNAETWTGKAAEAGIQYLGNMATGFVPSFIRGVAKATDPYYRDTTGNNPAEAALNSLKATIPGLRETLPKKLDNFGNEKMYSGNIVERLFNTLVNPGDRTTIRQGSASSMLEKLRNETGDANIYPDRKAPKSVEYDDVESKLTPEQKREWQRTAGQLSEKLINDLKDSGTFDRLTPQQQAQVVKSINSLAKDTAKQQFVESTGTDYTSDYDAIRELKSPSEFLTAKKALNDAKDKTKANFDAVDQVLKNFGLLKDDTQALLRDSGLSVDKLLYAAETGIDSEEWYDTYNAIKEHRNETGRESQWVSAEAIGSQVKGDDAAKLKALEAQLPPDDDGKRKSIVKRYDSAIDSGISWDDWTEIEKVVNTDAGGWGGTYGIYSGEETVKKALREAGYTSSQASRIWNVYKKTTDKKYQTASNDTSSSSSTSSNSVSTRSAEEYFRALGLLK